MNDYILSTDIDNDKFQKISFCNIISDYDAHHQIEVEVSIPPNETISILEIEHLLGTFVTVKFCKKSVGRGESLVAQGIFKGIIDAAKISSNANGEKTLKISGFSPTVLLDCGQPVKGYTDKSLEQIVKQTLVGRGISCKIAREVGQIQIPWTMQYFESDYNFLKRMADASGKFEFFYDGQNLAYKDITQHDASQVIKLIEGENLKALMVSFDIAPQQFSIKAYNAKNKKSLTAKPRPINTQSKLLKIVLDKSDVFAEERIFLAYSVQNQDYMNRMDKIIRAAQTNELLVVTGIANDPRIGVGSQIEIEANEGVLNGELSAQVFTVIRVEHQYSSPGKYSNRFVAVVSGLPLNLRMTYDTPKLSPTGAVVTDIDPAKGLLKVQLFCDQNQVKSPWIRFLTPFSGNHNGGFFLPPNIGNHVMVMGEDLNMNSLFVLGAFYAGDEAKNWGKGKIGFYADNKSGILFEQGEVTLFGDVIRFVSSGESSWDASALYLICNKGQMPTKR